MGFSGGSVVKKPPDKAGDVGSTPRWGRSPGEGDGYSLQYSCLEILWTEEPSRLQSLWLQKQADTTLQLNSNNLEAI